MRNMFFTSEDPKNYTLFVKCFCFFDNVFIWFGTKIYLIGTPMGTNCDPLMQICFCYVLKERSVLFKHSIRRLDNWRTCLILVMNSLNK